MRGDEIRERRAAPAKRAAAPARRAHRASRLRAVVPLLVAQPLGAFRGRECRPPPSWRLRTAVQSPRAGRRQTPRRTPSSSARAAACDRRARARQAAPGDARAARACSSAPRIERRVQREPREGAGRRIAEPRAGRILDLDAPARQFRLDAAGDLQDRAKSAPRSCPASPAPRASRWRAPAPPRFRRPLRRSATPASASPTPSPLSVLAAARARDRWNRRAAAPR